MSTGHVSGDDGDFPLCLSLTEFSREVQPEYTFENYLCLNGIDRPGIDKIIEKGMSIIMLIMKHLKLDSF